MKKKIIICIVILLLVLTGAFIGWLVFDAYKDDNIQYADIDKMISENADTAFDILSTESSLPDNIRGYIIDPEKDMNAADEESAKAVFEKVDAIQPDTVLIRYDKEKLSLLVSAAESNGLDVIVLLPENMLNKNDITAVCETYGTYKICVETSDIQKTEKIYPELKEANITLGIYLNEALSDEIKTSIENESLDFYFVQIDSTVANNAETVIKTWAKTALGSDSKIYAVLRNDCVTQENSTEIQTLVKMLYNNGGFSGCIMYDREKLSTDDNRTATNLYSYFEYFNNSDYTALTLTDFRINEDKTDVQFSGTSDNAYPVFAWSTSNGGWITAETQGDDGQFTVSIPLIEGANKIVIKHKNAAYTYQIDRAVDVMTACNAVSDGEKVQLTATAKKEADVYASVANTYLVKLEKTAENGDYAEFSAEFELSKEMSLLSAEQVSFAATYNGIDDIVMCNQAQKASPYNNNGLGNSDICLVTKNYSETTSTAAQDDSSDPTCTPQLAGSYGYIDSYLVSDNNVICVTSTGMKIHADDTRIILGGYTMPENTINLDSVSTQNGTTLTLTPTYPTFVKFVEAPQDYYKGYLQRIYNINEFTAEYVDIIFMDTAVCSYSSEPDFSASEIFSSAEWYTNSQTKNITLRLYLKEKGSFNGYSYSISDSGKITITFKNNTASLEGTVIMLDPGHGGYGNPGTNYGMSTYEEEITYSIAMQTAEILRKNGATVIVTRGDGEALTLSERVDMAREQAPDMFVSIHCDGSEATSWLGTHTFYYRSYSMPLASSIHSQIVKAYKQYYYTDPTSEEYADVDKGIKFYPFMVTRIEECPSVLVECGYLTNELDAQFLMSEGGQNVLATAIAQGIVDYVVNY